MISDEKTEGVVIGTLVGFEAGAPLVGFGGSARGAPVRARSIARLLPGDIGARVAILFEDRSRRHPLVIGRLLDDALGDVDVTRDGETVRIVAAQRIELRVGDAAIILEKDGHVTIRGSYIVSHASGANRVRGASVNLN